MKKRVVRHSTLLKTRRVLYVLCRLSMVLCDARNIGGMGLFKGGTCLLWREYGVDCTGRLSADRFDGVVGRYRRSRLIFFEAVSVLEIAFLDIEIFEDAFDKFP